VQENPQVLEFDCIVHLTRRVEVLARATAAVNRIDERLARAQRDGALSGFNQEYRRRRLAAAAAGKRFMSYKQAQARLRKALAGVAAGKVMTASIVASVFDGS
jgi:hypothetical protein